MPTLSGRSSNLQPGYQALRGHNPTHVPINCGTRGNLRVAIVHGGHQPSFDGTRLIELVDRYLASTS